MLSLRESRRGTSRLRSFAASRLVFVSGLNPGLAWMCWPVGGIPGLTWAYLGGFIWSYQEVQLFARVEFGLAGPRVHLVRGCSGGVRAGGPPGASRAVRPGLWDIPHLISPRNFTYIR